MRKINDILALCFFFIPDRLFTRITFFLKIKRWPNLANPVLFNEKLLYLKLNERKDLYKTLVDKYDVRNYIKNMFGDEYLIPLIGVYDSIEQIDFKGLPDKFALKLTNGSQRNLICTDKSSINWDIDKKKINNWLKQDCYKRTREWPYKDKKARFVIEQYMADKNGQLNDYKFWCFNGEPKFVQIDVDRFHNHKRDFYDIDFKTSLPYIITYPHSSSVLIKPDNYVKMVDMARTLSTGLKFVRIDLYDIDGQIFFGEITFYPGNCNEKITSRKHETEIGNLLDL